MPQVQSNCEIGSKMYKIRSDIIVALGGNLPFKELCPEMTLRQAIVGLASDDVVIRAVSRFYSTPCFPAGAGPDYVNAAVLIDTELGPEPLLQRLHAIEARFDRDRLQRWGMRTLDLDLLAYGQTILPNEVIHKDWLHLRPEEQIARTPDRLILPHPRLQDRAFALVPMADVAPHWMHPTLGKSAAELCANLPAEDLAQIRAL